MKKILFILLVFIGVSSCGSNQSNKTKTSSETSSKDIVEVIYFHGKKRCITCNAIENLTKEVINTNFAQQLESGDISFKIIDISTKEGEKIADNYEVTWSSIYINKWENGKESRNNMTEFGFSNAKGSPDVFKAGIKKKIDELLK